jgi:hypothetical protein
VVACRGEGRLFPLVFRLRGADLVRAGRRPAGLPGGAGVLAEAPLPGAADPVAPGGAGKVVLISIDGLRPDALFHAETPSLQALACRGAYSWQATTIPLSYTLPAHASMLSGFPPEAHGLFNDDLRRASSRCPPS